jgi:hypothetical protein
MRQAKFGESVERRLIQQGFDGKAEQNRGFEMPLLREQKNSQISSACFSRTHLFTISQPAPLPLYGLLRTVL